ncbi:MAG: potassium/proton antiporter, partial [Pseudorhizobium sp.]
LDAAYGPDLLSASEQNMTIADMMTHRLGGRADYADRVRLGSIVLIVRDLDEHDNIRSVGVSLEPVEPATKLPLFINMREIAHRVRDALRRYRGKTVTSPAANTDPTD